MSQAVVQQVIGRLTMERDFRRQVQADPDRALAGYDLTPGEREGLSHIDLADFDRAVAGLDERVSKGISRN